MGKFSSSGDKIKSKRSIHALNKYDTDKETSTQILYMVEQICSFTGLSLVNSLENHHNHITYILLQVGPKSKTSLPLFIRVCHEGKRRECVPL